MCSVLEEVFNIEILQVKVFLNLAKCTSSITNKISVMIYYFIACYWMSVTACILVGCCSQEGANFNFTFPWIRWHKSIAS